jgi:hypothetical protein
MACRRLIPWCRGRWRQLLYEPPVLGRLRPVRHEPEVDLERAAVSPGRHAIAAAVHHLPAQRPGPELREQPGVRRVNDQGSDPVLHLHVLALAARVANRAQIIRSRPPRSAAPGGKDLGQTAMRAHLPGPSYVPRPGARSVGDQRRGRPGGCGGGARSGGAVLKGSAGCARSAAGAGVRDAAHAGGFGVRARLTALIPG